MSSETAQPSQGGEGPSNFREILNHAALRGQEMRQAKELAFRERVLQVKEKVGQGWQAVKEVGRKIDRALLIADAIRNDPEIQREIIDYARLKFQERRENLSRRIGEIWEGFNDKRREAVNAAEVRILAIARGANERVIRPTVDGAKKIGKGVIKGAKAGALFTIGVAVAPAVGAYKLGEATVEGGKKGIEATKRGIEGAKLKAEEWGDRLVGFFERQWERLKNNVRRGINEVQAVGLTAVARGHEALAVPHQLRVRIAELRAQRTQAKTEAERQRFDEQINRLRDQLERKEAERERRLEEGRRKQEVIAARRREAEQAAEGRRAKAVELRDAARALRGGEGGR